MKPVRDNLLLKDIEEEATSASGLILSGTSGESLFQKALVVGVGSEVEDVKVGDKISYIKSQGAELSDNGEKFKITGFKHVVVVYSQ